MADLISRAAVKQAFIQYKNDVKVLTPFELNRLVDLFAIKGLPVVDAVPVVRCGDCKYWYAELGASTGWLPCQEIATNRVWYCANGKRRESE